ncbi:TetR/AcrR family transcriptional regulator [Rhodovibrionaceae bacterium A322]
MGQKPTDILQTQEAQDSLKLRAANAHNLSKGDRTREHILRIAARLYSEQGFGTTSLRDIAAAAGMKAGSLYYHFNSKEDIVVEVLNAGIAWVFEEVRLSVDSMPGDADSLDKISQAIRAHLVILHEESAFTAANMRIFAQVPDEVRQRHLPLRRAYEDYWAQLIKDAQKEGKLNRETNASLLRLSLLGALNSSIEWYRADKSSLEAVAANISEIFLKGAQAR